MKVITKIIYNKKKDGVSEIKEIQLVRVSFCCKEMGEVWEEGAVDFGEYDGILNRDNNVNIYRCNPYPEGAVWDQFPIKFCPFCGEGIIIECEAKSDGEKEG